MKIKIIFSFAGENNNIVTFSSSWKESWMFRNKMFIQLMNFTAVGKEYIMQ